MYLLSFQQFIFYKIKKILSLLFHFDNTWKISTVFAFIVILFFSILSPIFAAGSDGSETGILPATAHFFSDPLIGGRSDPNGKSSIDQLLVTKNTAYPSATSSSVPGKADLTDYSNYRYGGAVGASMFLGGAMFDVKPASVRDAVTYQADKAGITVGAQVQGFNQLGPIVTLWGVFRNIALLLFVVVFVAIGFFILIQRKVGGQETVSLVSGITNAAVAMVIIAFSYAIGGLIIDIFSTVMSGVVATTFGGFINSQDILNQLQNPNSGVNVLTLMSDLTNIGVSQSATNLFSTALQGIQYPAGKVKDIFQNINYNVGILPVGSAVGLFASSFIDILMGIISSAFNNSSLIEAVVAFIIFIIMLRVVFALLGAYVSLIFKIMFAPLILLPAALPGNAGKAIFGWLLSLISSALVFPGIFACILMSAMFLNLNTSVTTTESNICKYSSQLNPGNRSTIQGNAQSSKYFLVTRLGKSATENTTTTEPTQCYPLALPPKFNYWPAPLGYINGVEPDDLIRFVVAFAFIVITPSVPKILQQLLKVPQDSLLAGVSQGFKSGAGAFSGFISAVPSFGIGRAIGSVTRSAADSAQ